MLGKPYSSSTSWLHAAAGVLDECGMDGRKTLASSGIFIEDYRTAGKRAPTTVIRKAWAIVAEHTDDPAIGLRAAQKHFRADDWQSLGLAIQCSTTLREALQRLVRYFQVVSDAADCVLLQNRKTLSLVATPYDDPEQFGYEAMEYGVAALLVLLQDIHPHPLHPLRVELLRPRSLSSLDFARLLGCPVTFGCERQSIVFDLRQVDTPLRGRNAALAKYQDAFSEDYLARFGNRSLSMKVRQEILRSLPGGSPNQEAVAAALHMSVRKLQRVLVIEQTSFREILTGIRQHLSTTYLRQEGRGLAEVAFMLGFSDHSNFSRAFKEWFGRSPSEYRQKPARK